MTREFTPDPAWKPVQGYPRQGAQRWSPAPAQHLGNVARSKNTVDIKTAISPLQPAIPIDGIVLAWRPAQTQLQMP
ncbi:MAG: hypothetical protein WBF88_07415 [Pusillimonas sp.]